MASLHDVDELLGEIAGRPSVFNHNLRLAASEFSGYELVNEVSLAGSNGSTEHVYLYAQRKAATETLLRVSVSEHPDARHALLALIESLDNSMNPEVARAGGKLAKLADIGFVRAGEGDGKGLGVALLSVGNAAVSVRSAGKAPADVTAAAERVGKLLGTPPDKSTQRAGRASALPPPAARMSAGEVLTLIEKLPEGGPAADRIQVIAPRGELRRDGDALVYVAVDDGSPQIAGYTHPQGQTAPP
ncbi:MAG TPA: hypothetical protein VFL64_00805 [Rhizobacter sp.]|nr:hypothetical protein [Rhizobacter sp.]